MAKEKKEKKMPFKKLLAKIRLGLTKPEKYTQEGLNQYIRDKGWTEEDFKKATVNHATIAVRKSNPKSLWGVTKGYFREVADGLTFGFSNTVDKYLTAIINNDGIELPSEDELEYTKQLIAQERADYQEANPITSTVGNIAGAMTTGAGVVGGLYKVAPKLAATTGGSAIGNFGKDLAVNVGTGIGEGALYAYNTDQDVTSGSGLGGIGGTRATVAGRGLHGLGKAASKVKSIFTNEDAKDIALKRIDEDFNLDRVDPEAKLTELEDLGLGDQTRTANLGGANTQQTAKDAINARGEAKTIVRAGLEEDLAANRELTTETFKKGLGFNKLGSDQLKDDILLKMKTDAKPFYDQAYSLPPINNAELDSVIRTIDKTTGKGNLYQGAKDLAEQELELLPEEIRGRAILPDEMPYGNMPVAVVDYVKRSLDDLIDTSKGNKRRNLIKLKNKMLDITDASTAIKPQPQPQNPNALALLDPSESLIEVGQSPYKIARSIWSEGMDNNRALELGEKAYSSKSAAKMRFEFNNLKSQAEKDLYRLGASTEAVTNMNKLKAEGSNVSKKMLDPEAREKHEILFGDSEKTQEFINRLRALSDMHKSNTAMMPRSDTSANLMRFAQDMTNFVSTGGSLPRKVAITGGRIVAGKLAGNREAAINKEMGELLNTKGGQNIRSKVIEPIKEVKKKDEKEFSQSLINRGLLTGALTNTQAQMLGGGGLLQ